MKNIYIYEPGLIAHTNEVEHFEENDFISFSYESKFYSNLQMPKPLNLFIPVISISLFLCDF